MIENRGMQPDDPDFYLHFHPIQDLLKFLDDEHANDDPRDQTIGAEFSFRVFTRRWGHDDTYKVIRTKDGWDISHIAIGGPCDKSGKHQERGHPRRGVGGEWPARGHAGAQKPDVGHALERGKRQVPISL